MTKRQARGRPKSEAKREQIFDTAAELFLEHGFDNVSMDQVAERAGVSKQTVYSHFRNKDELYGAIISRKCVANRLAAEFLDEDRPVADMLREIGRRFLDLLLSPEAINVYRLSVGNAAQHPHIARLFYRAGPLPTIEVVADYLRRQHTRGRLRVADPRRAACQFLFMLKGEAVLRATLNIEEQAPPEELGAYLDDCVAMFLRAYGAHADSGSGRGE